MAPASELAPAVHALEFIDRTARPATWRALCEAAGVPLEQTTSVQGNITCTDCIERGQEP